MESILNENKTKITCEHLGENDVSYDFEFDSFVLFVCSKCNKDLQDQMQEHAAQEAAK